MSKKQQEAHYCAVCGDPRQSSDRRCSNCGESFEADKVSRAKQAMPTLNGLKADLAVIIGKLPAGRWPASMPRDPDDAVSWWLKLIEPHTKQEAPYQYAVQGGSKGDSKWGWSWPYEIRVRYLLKAFLSQSGDFQRLIVDAAEDRIYWRGDDEEFFKRVISETLRMREIGVEAYRKESRQKVRELLTKGLGNAA